MKKTLALLLALLMALSLAPAAFAEEEEFVIKDGASLATLGAYPNGCHNILTDYNGTGGAVTIPNGVDAICYNSMGESLPVFGADSGVVSIVVPASVKIIGSRAFENCSTLKKVTLTEGLEELGYSCFKGCTNLTDIAIPDGIAELEASTFSGCTSLARITLPASLKSVHTKTFENCTALREITYTGTRDQWRANYTAIGSLFDKSIVVHCTDGDYKDAGLSNFVRESTYRDGQFSDVKTTDWFSSDVRTAVEFGLMNGTGSGSFSPDGNISIAETLALASRIHHIYNGGSGVFTQGSPWYQTYVDYAVENRMISAGSYPDPSAPATRAQFSVIIAKALPASELNQINTVSDQGIPDVTPAESYGAVVYQLYRAGILTGSDANGTFYPNSTITRSSVAAIASRMVDKNLRKSITLTPVTLTLYSPDGRTMDVIPNEVDAYLAVGWYEVPVVSMHTTDGTIQVVPISDALEMDYRYLVQSDARRILIDYPSATMRYGSWAVYVNSKGELCVGTRVSYTIITDFDDCVLHNLTTGGIIVDPVNYFKGEQNRVDAKMDSASANKLFDLYDKYSAEWFAIAKIYDDYLSARLEADKKLVNEGFSAKNRVDGKYLK